MFNSVPSFGKIHRHSSSDCTIFGAVNPSHGPLATVPKITIYIYPESIVLRIPEGHTIERLEQRITELKRGVERRVTELERRASRMPNMKIPEFQVNC